MSYGVGAPEAVTAAVTAIATVLSAFALATIFAGEGIQQAFEYSFLAVSLLGFGLVAAMVLRAGSSTPS